MPMLTSGRTPGAHMEKLSCTDGGPCRETPSKPVWKHHLNAVGGAGLFAPRPFRQRSLSVRIDFHVVAGLVVLDQQVPLIATAKGVAFKPAVDLVTVTVLTD